MILGTPFYMSPEQVRGAPLDGRSDQFALAVIAYQMLTGRRPFEGEHVTSICYQIVHADPPSLADINPELPPAVSQVLRRALDKDPAKRFPTCTEFATALVHSCEHGITQAAAGTWLCKEVTMPIPPPAVSRRSILQLLVIVAMCSIAVLAGCAWFFRPRLNERASASVVSQPSIAATAAPLRQEQNEAATAPNGRIIWTGQARRGTLLRMESGSASTGKVFGALPGEPVEVHIFPAERSLRRITVFTADERYVTPVRATTAAGRAVFSWDPRHIMDATLWEPPGPANNWRTLVLRVNSEQLTACVVEWTKKVK